ncbi:YgiT-type zinc finger protein [Anaerolineales bacterium HSG6]|nr:YgiT-type zinc finger protein [Anaerolineales bacterium HSG6]MDM8531867.1 YgiT-type zinc finger protein [Anaerolineales bacterium HSG25]
MNICPVCNSGRLQRRTMTYIEWYGKELLVIDKMPALVCDACGEQVYDRNAMETLQRLLWSPPPTKTRATISAK